MIRGVAMALALASAFAAGDGLGPVHAIQVSGSVEPEGWGEASPLARAISPDDCWWWLCPRPPLPGCWLWCPPPPPRPIEMASPRLVIVVNGLVRTSESPWQTTGR